MPRRTARVITATATVAVVMMMAGCASGAATGAAGGATPTGEPVEGGTLTYLEYQPYTNLYPPQAGFYPNGALVGNITDRLTWQNPETLEIEPWVATSWTVNDDATQYTFELRDDVTFSDGTPLDAAAVAKNFDTFGAGASDRALTVSEAINNYAGSTVVDADTVSFAFSAPSPGFLQATSTITSGLVAPSNLDGSLDDFGAGNGTKIIGSGAFVIAEEKLGAEITLAAREDYDWAPESWPRQGRALLDEITILVTPEDSVRIGSLLSGQADIARYVQAFDEPRVTSSGFTLHAPQTRGVNNSLSLRFTNPILSDLRVRQALVAGMNAQEVVDTVYTANYPVATSVLSSSALGYKDESEHYAYDPEKANALLDDAGWTTGTDGIREKDGQRLELPVYESKAQPLSKQALELVSQQLGAIGVDLQVKAADAGSYAQDILDPLKTPLYHSMVGRADLDVIKSQYATTNRNTLLSDDKKLDELLAKVAGEPDAQARIAASEAVQDYLAEQAYVIPLFEEPQVYGASPAVQGFSFESVGRPVFHNTWLTQE